MGNKYKEKFEKNANQMYKIDASGKFAEFLSPTPDFQKVRLNIFTYNKTAPQGQRIKDKATYYFDLPYFLEMCRAISNNEIFAKAQTATAYKNLVQDDYGMNTIRDKAGKIIKTEGTKFAIEKADKGVFLKIYVGDYVINEKNQPNIVNIKNSVGICVSWQHLYEMAAICKVRVEALIFKMEMLGLFDVKPQSIMNTEAANTYAQPSYSPAPPETEFNPDYYLAGYNGQAYTEAPQQPAINSEVTTPDIADYGEGGFFYQDDLPFKMTS